MEVPDERLWPRVRWCGGVGVMLSLVAGVWSWRMPPFVTKGIRSGDEQLFLLPLVFAVTFGITGGLVGLLPSLRARKCVLFALLCIDYVCVYLHLTCHPLRQT